MEATKHSTMHMFIKPPQQSTIQQGTLVHMAMLGQASLSAKECVHFTHEGPGPGRNCVLVVKCAVLPWEDPKSRSLKTYSTMGLASACDMWVCPESAWCPSHKQPHDLSNVLPPAFDWLFEVFLRSCKAALCRQARSAKELKPSRIVLNQGLAGLAIWLQQLQWSLRRPGFSLGYRISH